MKRNELAQRSIQNRIEYSEQDNPFESPSYPLLNPSLYQFRSVKPSIYVRNYQGSKERAEEIEKQFKSLHLEHDRYQKRQYNLRSQILQKEINPPMRMKFRSENERIHNTINSLSLDYSGYIEEKKEKEKKQISYNKNDSWDKIPVQKHDHYMDGQDPLEIKYINKTKKKDFVGTVRSDPSILTYSKSIRTFKQNQKLSVDESTLLKNKQVNSLYNHSNNYQSLKDLKPVIKLNRYNKSRIKNPAINYITSTPKAQIKLPPILGQLDLIKEQPLRTNEDAYDSPRVLKVYKSVEIQKEGFKPVFTIDDKTTKKIVASYFK